METRLNELLSKLTSIPVDALDNISNLSCMVASEAVVESSLAGNDRTDLDIGIGILSILHSPNEVKFRFSPSAKLQEGIVGAVRDGKSTLEVAIEDKLKERMLHTYKDLM